MLMRRRDSEYDPRNIPAEFASEFTTGERARLIETACLGLQAQGYARKEIYARVFEFESPKILQGMQSDQRPDIVANNGKHRVIGTVVLREDFWKLEARIQLIASACQMYQADFLVACPAEIAESLRGRLRLWEFAPSYFWPL